MADGIGQVGAHRWERQRAEVWAHWRASDTSSGRPRLEALATAVSELARTHLRRESDAEAVVREFPAVLRSCDTLTFERPTQTLAYMLWHLTDRYGRVTQVLDRLFAHGHLPLRKRGLSVREDADIAPVATLHAIDRGPAWSTLLHQLSETLIAHYPPSRRSGQAINLPFNISYDELSNFSIRELHDESLAHQSRAIQDEFDRGGEYLSLHTARKHALDDGCYPPSAYDLIVMCNFLTTEEITRRFAAEIRTLATSLTPGGLLVVLGATGRRYPVVYGELRSLLAATRLRPLPGFEQELQAQEAVRQRQVVGAQIRGNVAYASAVVPNAFA